MSITVLCFFITLIISSPKYVEYLRFRKNFLKFKRRLNLIEHEKFLRTVGYLRKKLLSTEARSCRLPLASLVPGTIARSNQFLPTVKSPEYAETVARRCFIKKVFLEILRNSEENTWASLWHETVAQAFPVKFAKFLRTPFLTEHLRWLPLNMDFIIQVL